jgi:4-hydroxy-tetrahydrodipicolinate synthase
MSIFQGAATALLTPFTADGQSIDFEALTQMINWQIGSGIDGLIVGSTTGEAVALTENEHKAIIAFTVQTVNGRVPVMAGTGSNNTAETIQMTQYAEAAGADGVLIVTPYYNKPSQKGLIAHYTAIHDSSNIPIILYNVPSRTGVNMTPKTVLALSELPRIVALKEASNDFSQITELARILPSDFTLYSGNDDTILPFMALGGQGVISVTSNIIPKEIHTLTTDYLNGDVKGALSLQLALKPLIDSLFLEVNPIPAKCATELLNRPLGPLRLPLVEIDASAKCQIEREIERLGLSRGYAASIVEA